MKRPILSELWSIFYRNVPPAERQTYEAFINEIQGLTIDIANDPTLVNLDAFANEHRQAANLVTDDKQTVGLICANHAEIQKNPVVVEEDESVKNDQLSSGQPSQSPASATTTI